MKVLTGFSFMMLLAKIINAQSIIIINGPEDTTVCMNVMAEVYCGFTGANPIPVIPNWRIVFKSDNGSIISNDTIDGEDIINRFINGLQWLPDLTSGDNNATNSKLLVGPVNMTHNQSSYQCIFSLIGDSVISSVGTMTVVDAPSVIINVDEICTTSIIISLNTHSHPACENVSHNVTISGNVTYPDTVGGSKYTIDGLSRDALYNIIVTSTYNNNGSRVFSKSVRTSLPKPPYPIDVTSIESEKTDDSNVRIMWKQPEIDKCSMSAIEHYDVRIHSDEGEIIASGKTDVNSIILPFEHMNDYSNVAFTAINVTVTVVDIEGQSSITSSVTVIINDTQNTNFTGETGNEESDKNSDENSDDNDAIVIPITVVAIVSVVLVIIIITFIIIYLRYRYLHKSYDIKSGKQTEDNCYVETQDGSKNHDLASIAPYAVSGPTSAWSDSTHSNKNETETILEPSIDHDHVNEPLHDDNINEDKSTPPLQPKLNYAEIQLGNEVPKFMKADNHVAYAETKPA